MKRQKGAITLGGVLAVLAIIVAIGVGIYLLGGHGGGHGGGEGSGEGSGDVAEETDVSAESSSIETTHTEISTEQMSYLLIVISENEYLFQNSKYSSSELDKLIEDIRLAEETESVPIKITDDNASQRAYSNLKSALKESKIRFIDEISGE